MKITKEDINQTSLLHVVKEILRLMYRHHWQPWFSMNVLQSVDMYSLYLFNLWNVFHE